MMGAHIPISATEAPFILHSVAQVGQVPNAG